MSGIFSFLLFDLQKREYIAGIDEKLLTAARMAKSMLPEDYHDRIRDQNSVARDDFVKIVESFDRICADLGLQYLWSNLVLDGRIVFTTATSTSKRPGSGDHAGFLDDHRDPAAFAPVIASGRTTFSTFHNEWGDGRMVLVPDRDALGRLHVFGASVGIAELDAKLRERAVSAALVFVSMLGLGTLVSLIAAGRVTRSIRRLTETAQAIASGGWGRQVRIEEGGAELRSLATSVNTMSEAVRRHTENLRDLVAERTAEIVAQKERAEAALRVKSDFLANMSHEIRTPLNAVIGFAQLLERDRDLTPAQKESAAAIARGGEHLLDLIDDVLEMSKAEAGRGALRPTTFALPAFLDDLRAMMAPRAAARGLDLSFEPDAAMPALIVADLGKLRQVLINLLGNAIKFTDEGGVALRARGDGGALVIEVEDSGKGIAAEDLETIFQPFEQTAVGVATGGGTGLGLAIVREHVRRMGGTVTVTSEVGRGSVFRVRIPVGEGRAADLPPPRPTRRITRLRPGRPPVRLLIVDDHPPNRTYLTRLLQGAGFVTVEAADGAEAVRLTAELRPDAVLMDIVMPVMDGLEATRRIRALPEGRGIRVIAVSASLFEEDRGRVLAAGADDFLRKPIRDSDLLESIGRQLGLDWERAAVDHAALGRLPPDLAQRLRDAARAFQLTESRAILDEMAALEPGLARDLRAVLDEFDWDGLSAALGPVEANP